MEICRRQKPPYFEADEEHEVACFLYDQHLGHDQHSSEERAAS
jgi:hypothetical protein